jgi:uncharacterized protein
MQTNATLVTEAVAERLAALDVHVGVSLDGGEKANSHRLDLGGKSSFNRVVRGISHLAKFPGLIQGALAVIDLYNDPGDVYGTIKSLGFTSLDVLLPHGTWEAVPVRPTPGLACALRGLVDRTVRDLVRRPVTYPVASVR